MLALTLLFACGTTDPGQAQTVPTVEDMDAALERIEALEAQIAALQAAVGVAPVEDADHDGYRDSDGLPVGTRRGDVLWEGRCDGDGDFGREITFPNWLARPRTPGQPPVPAPYWAWVCSDDACFQQTSGDFEVFEHASLSCDVVYPNRLIFIAR